MNNIQKEFIAMKPDAISKRNKTISFSNRYFIAYNINLKKYLMIQFLLIEILFYNLT